MKYLVTIILFSLSLLACTGDCMSCHPKLVSNIDKDQRHKPMLTCIKCHPADPSSTAECGDECFSCHKASEIYKTKIKEHQVIQSCIDCHEADNDKIFNPLNSFDQSNKESLEDFLVR